jgi:hypothetical protein
MNLAFLICRNRATKYINGFYVSFLAMKSPAIMAIISGV